MTSITYSFRFFPLYFSQCYFRFLFGFTNNTAIATPTITIASKSVSETHPSSAEATALGFCVLSGKGVDELHAWLDHAVFFTDLVPA